MHLIALDSRQRQQVEQANLRAQLSQVSHAFTESRFELSPELRLLADNLPQQVSYIDAEGRLCFINEAGERWLGCSRELLRGRQLGDVLGPGEFERLRPFVGAALRGQEMRFQLVLPGPDGKQHDCRLRYLPDRREDGNVHGFFSVIEVGCTDASPPFAVSTQPEQDEGQLHTQASLGRFAGSIAHEFNNLLQVVINGCRLAQSRSVADGDARAPLEDVIQAARRGVSLSRQLLSVGRDRAAGEEVIELDAQLNTMLPLLRFLLGAEVELDTDLHAACLVRANTSLLQQVTINLSVNARDAMAARGQVRLTTRRRSLDDAAAARLMLAPRDYAVMSLSDNGRGMDAQTLARIFDVGFTTKPASQGAGLGLALVRGLMREVQGDIRARSVPGEGTQFELWFPVVGAP